MNIYVLQVSLIVIFCFLKKNRRLAILIALFLGAVLLLRTPQIGTDLSRYHTHFVDCGRMGLREIYEHYGNDCTGFYILTHFLYILTSGNYQLYLIIYGLLTFIPVIHLILRLSDHYMYSLLTYVCFGYYSFQFSGLKQALSFAILSYAFMAILDRKPIRFYVLVVLATTFHTPAIIFAPAYLFSTLSWSSAKLFLYGVFFTILYSQRLALARFLSEQYETVVDFSGNIRAGGKVLLILGLVFIGLLFCDFTRSVYAMELLRFMIIAAMIQTLAVFGNVFERLADYYFFFSILYIPFIIENPFKNNSSVFYEESYGPAGTATNFNSVSILKAGLAALLILYFYLFILNTPNLNPYKTWLSDVLK